MFGAIWIPFYCGHNFLIPATYDNVVCGLIAASVWIDPIQISVSIQGVIFIKSNIIYLITYQIMCCPVFYPPNSSDSHLRKTMLRLHQWNATAKKVEPMLCQT